MFFNKVILCFKFLPKPMPGSKIIFLCLIPFDLKNLFCFQKNHKYQEGHYYILVSFAYFWALLACDESQMEYSFF